jgi:LacI family transcriptional regulator
MNMGELARLCQLSKGAVSMAMHNHPRIPERTRLRVRAEAARHGFQVDPKVSQVMSALGRRKTEGISTPIAILSMFPRKTPWNERGGLADYHRGLITRAAQLGFKTEDFWLGDPEMPAKRMEGILEARGIESAIVFSYPTALSRITIDLSRFACSVVGRALESPRLYAVDHDYHHGMFLALKRVRALGFSRPGLVLTDDLNERTLHCWVAAYLFENSQLPARRQIPFWIIPPKPRKAAFLRWFKQYRPDVILGHDLVLPFLSEAGISIPGTVAFATLAWIGNAPQYAGVDTRRDLIAARAVEIVVEQLRHNRRGIPQEPETTLLEGIWRDGPSLSKG